MASSNRSPGPFVLVTGGAGFIGSHTVDRLVDAGCKVVVLDDLSAGRLANLAPWKGNPRVEIVRANVAEDLFEPLAPVTGRRAGFDAVIHLAAQTAVTRSIEDPFGDIRVNYTGTVRVLEYARRTNVKKIVFASSSAVYGNEVDLPACEEAAPRPRSPYGVNKLASERILDCYASIWGLRWTAFRFFNVYGPRQDPGSPYSGVISILARQALAGEPLTIDGDGEQTRDFVFVGDVARAVADASLKDVADRTIVNLGTGTEISINDLARLLLQLSGAKSELRHGQPRPGDIRRSVARIERARSVLGYEPTVSLRDGLGKTLQWFRESGPS